ncbi:hypothetical protein [Tropicimonas sp.]|uniref:hypothetical protein n=1 Tax=Tropicimonas sp. TaxID=2067044 RepID=UPI003A8B9018
MKAVIVLTGLALLAACASEGIGELAMLGPYRDAEDECRWVSPTEATTAFMSTEADLVACPRGYEGTGTLVSERKAEAVGSAARHTLFLVPHR